MVILQAVSLSRSDDAQFASPYHRPAMHLWPKGMVFYDVSKSGTCTSMPDLQVLPQLPSEDKEPRHVLFNALRLNICPTRLDQCCRPNVVKMNVPYRQCPREC